MNKVNLLPPFKRLCVTIGNLPSSYVDSMSYYECLMWLCQYLQNTVVPAINENAEAVNELINWFNNLDVQDEINNKLDEMAESGELEEIISAYLNSKAIFGYDTVADMKSAENLIDGSYARTLGYHSLNDNGGALYKIREITNSDTVDEMLLIAIGEDLVAELIVFDKVNVDQLGAYGDNSHDDLDSIEKALTSFKTVEFSNKTYKLSETITASYVKSIVGNNSTIQYYGTSDMLVLTQCNIKGMTFKYTGNESIDGVEILNAKHIVIENNIFDGFNNNLIMANHQYSKVINNEFKNWGTNGLYMYNSSADLGDSKVLNNNFFPDNTNLTRNLTNAIYMTSGGGTLISHNKINWHDNTMFPKNGIVWNSTSGASTSDIIISNNSIENCSLKAIDIETDSSTEFYNIIIEGNEIASYTSTRENGIYINGKPNASYSTILNCNVANNIIKGYTTGMNLSYINNLDVNNNILQGLTTGIYVVGCKAIIGDQKYSGVTTKLQLPNASNNAYNYKTILNSKEILDDIAGDLLTISGYRVATVEVEINGFIEGTGVCYYRGKKNISCVNNSITLSDLVTEVSSGVTVTINKDNSTHKVTLATSLDSSTFFGIITYKITGNVATVL